MMTTTFETKKFRVQISGKSAWVETKEGEGWIFRNQHTLPMHAEALQSRNATLLRSALQQYELAHPGDTTMREAITGIRATPTPAVRLPQVPRVQALPVRRVGMMARISASVKSFRVPLRPPLAPALNTSQS